MLGGEGKVSLMNFVGVTADEITPEGDIMAPVYGVALRSGERPKVAAQSGGFIGHAAGNTGLGQRARVAKAVTSAETGSGGAMK